jgi:hypothetical protein
LNVVIPYQRHHRIPQYRDVELKYALRSIDKFIGGEVWVIGDKTPFKVNHIPSNNEGFGKEYRIFKKLMKAFELFDEFIMWNDDHFMLQPSDIKYWHMGDIKKIRQRGEYGLAVKNTIEAGCEKYYDIHTPIIYERERFYETVKSQDWRKQYVIKSLYCKGMEGEYMEDLKINAPLSVKAIRNKIQNRVFFSTGHYGLTPQMIEVLEELYPNPSKYEL